MHKLYAASKHAFYVYYMPVFLVYYVVWFCVSYWGGGMYELFGGCVGEFKLCGQWSCRTTAEFNVNDTNFRMHKSVLYDGGCYSIPNWVL